MARLKNRQKQIPGGLKFIIPQTNFKAPAFASFETIVTAVMSHLQANPRVAAQNGWPTDHDGVANMVDEFNAAICERMGWGEFIMQPQAAPPPPKFKALTPLDQKQISAVAGKVKKVWQGVKSIDEWIQSDIPSVPAEQANKRATVCAACPQNGQGGMEEWFTKPASEAIKMQFEKAAQRKLATPSDDKINICKACLCPLKLMVHVPLEIKTKHMGEETRKALDPNCWILAEESAQL